MPPHQEAPDGVTRQDILHSPSAGGAAPGPGPAGAGQGCQVPCGPCSCPIPGSGVAPDTTSSQAEAFPEGGARPWGRLCVWLDWITDHIVSIPPAACPGPGLRGVGPGGFGVCTCWCFWVARSLVPSLGHMQAGLQGRVVLVSGAPLPAACFCPPSKASAQYSPGGQGGVSTPPPDSFIF